MVLKKININFLSDAEKGYLIGLFVGDGYLYYDKWRHYKVEFYFNPIKDGDIAKFAIDLLKLIGLSPYTMHHHRCLIIRVNSKELYEYLANEVNGIKTGKNNDLFNRFYFRFY
jgi:hypothetical protein